VPGLGPLDPLPAGALRWRCDPARLPFETTDEVEPIAGVVGQPSAVEALYFGISSDAPGQNVFIRGLAGTGRMTLVRRLLEQLQPFCKRKLDRCYVHSFATPDRPHLISLPAGTAREFRREVQEFAEFIRDGLRAALNSEAIRARREALQRREKAQLDAITGPFERALKAAGLALVSVQLGPIPQTAIFPVVDGKTVAPDDLDQLVAAGTISEEQAKGIRERGESFERQLGEVTERVREARRKQAHKIHAVIEEAARAMLGSHAREILSHFPGDDVKAFLNGIVEDVADNRLAPGQEDAPDPTRLYGVHILVEHDADATCPIVIETTPTLGNLLGCVDREWTPGGPAASDHRMIRAGSILRADGGYLILDARDVLGEPGAWKVLMRTLRTGLLEIVPPDIPTSFWAPTLKPEAIPVKVRVILLGDSSLYYLLDTHDPDFGHLFKVLADFDTEIDREPEGVRQYAAVLARIAQEEKLPPFHRTAVAALVEHGARIAARAGKLTARFGRVGDIAREAAFLASERKAKATMGEDVADAVRRTKRRGDLPSRHFRSYVRDGIIRIQTRGSAVGQINGLAVIHAGPLTYGFPARITASIGPGSAGIIDIEGQASLSGQIHTKGFQILGGLLRNLLRTDHPLAFSASLAFEQSYGGIDGDSASGAEILCLLSALTGVPLRQDLAITGAIDQFGALQAIGGVTEKIEGFYDACEDAGLTGTQGVIIPLANSCELMVRHGVVDACAAGKFHVYAVGTVCEALEILTGQPSGVRDAEGNFPEDSVLGIAVDKAYEYWRKSLRGGEMDEVGPGEGADEGAPEPPEDDIDDG